jgi:hypothetical protein
VRWQLEEVVVIGSSAAGDDVVINVDFIEHIGRHIINRDINRHINRNEHVAVRQQCALGRSRGVDAAQRQSGGHA